MSIKDIIIHKVNETYVRLECSEGITTHIYNSFRFTNRKLQHHPKVKARLWSGYITMLDRRNNYMYLGLIEDLVKFCIEHEYTYEFTFKKENNYDEQLLSKTLELLVEDSFQLREHQLNAVNFALKNNRGVIVSATASGKSLVLYIISMYYLLKDSKKVLIVVPRTQLVTQLKDGFVEYHKGDKEEFSKSFELIYSGSLDRNSADSSITISTWQSLMSKPKAYFEDFDVVIVDEVHGAKAKSITTIMENCTNAKFKFGCTGTLSNENEESEIDELVIKGLFGRVETVSKNRELMDKGIITEATIHLIHLKYTDKTLCSMIIKGNQEIREIQDYTTKRKKIFEAEISYVINSVLRNLFIRNLAMTRKGNTIVMFQFVEKQGKILYDLFHDIAESVGKEVFYIHGKVNVVERNRIQELVEKQDNIILVSSFGTSSTGLDYKNIHNIIFASGFKSKITMKQSIGRGLRKHKNKEMLHVYDIADDFSMGKKTKNFMFNHFIERVQMYKEEKFKIELTEYEVDSTNILKRIPK